ncbi:MAG TPA: DUF3300 domain-containing protein [Phycisphaerales bacterium]|nr:DUF3300 domain-containing protein [Phycisphaerales bacterium]HMP36359.1 DUF3300 domain-containing protein [Phycisphaerales bacterium]
MSHHLKSLVVGFRRRSAGAAALLLAGAACVTVHGADADRALRGPSEPVAAPELPGPISLSAIVAFASPVPSPMLQDSDMQRLRNIVAPIALLPDPLLAEVIAASNFWPQIVRANQVILGGATQAQLRQLRAPAPVQVLMAVPYLLNEIAQRQEWTLSLNQASRRTPRPMFQAIQELRRVALTNGALVDSSSVAIVDRDGVIRIEPANASGVPVPTYDPAVVFDRAREPGSVSPIGFTAFIPIDAFVEPIEIDWAQGRIANGFGPWFTGTLGRDSRGNVIASGTFTVLGARPGYEGTNWRPNGTIVNPGSISTQGHALEPMQPLPWVLPTQPLAPAQPLQPVSAVAPVRPLQPRAPVQPISYRQPVQPLAPVQPIPSTLAGGGAFWPGNDGGAAAARGARSMQGGGW